MPCNSKSCPDFSPLNDPNIGIIMSKENYPKRNTNHINAPTWERDRVMYDFDDVCRFVAPNRYTTYSTSPTTTPSYIFGNKNEINDTAGKLNAPLTTTKWWESGGFACNTTNIPGTIVSPTRTRYWDNYPSEISFEPNFSDSWFYYMFDTYNGVTGTPCHAWCFTVTYTAGTGSGSGATAPQWTYQMRKTPFECPCHPDETYIRYNLEDGLTNPAYDEDAYPLFWAVGTKRQAVAFRYTTKSASVMLRYRPNEGSESHLVYRQNATLGNYVYTRWGLDMWGSKEQYGSQFPHGYESRQNVSFSNGMILDMTFKAHRTDRNHSNTEVKVNGVVAAPTGGWPSSRTVVSVKPRSPLTNSILTKEIMGDIVIVPAGTNDNPNGKVGGVPVDFMIKESKFVGGLFAVTGNAGWSTFANNYMVWPNNAQNNLVGREINIINKKIPVAVAGTYSLEMAIDDQGTIAVDSFGVTKEGDDYILTSSDENKQFTVNGGYGGSTISGSFTVAKPGFVNFRVKILNGGTNTNWTANPGGYAIVLRNPSGTIVWTSRDAVNGINGGDCFRGMKLKDAGFVDAWNGAEGIAFQSTAGDCWVSNNTTVYKDYSMNGGLRIRMKIDSQWDSVNNRYNTIWKIHKVLSRGYGYSPGNGVDFIDQNKYVLYFPDKDAADRISVTLIVSETQDTQEVVDGVDYLSSGMTVNGWNIKNVKHSEDEFNMHLAEISGGTADFTKDATYTVSNGQNIKVVAGWGIKDRAILIGRYEFRKKEIEYGIAIPNEGIPFAPELVKPKCVAKIENGRVTKIQIISKGRGLTNKNIENIKIAVSPPPTYFNHDLYNTLITQGVSVAKAKRRCKGTGTIAQLQPVIVRGRLVDVRVINGGSGYSSTNPPDVFVPYIARRIDTVAREAKDINIAEADNYRVFRNSPIFQTYNTKGLNWQSYSKKQTDVHNEVITSRLKPDVDSMRQSNTKRSFRYEDRGVKKNFIRAFREGDLTADQQQQIQKLKERREEYSNIPNISRFSSETVIINNTTKQNLTQGKWTEEQSKYVSTYFTNYLSPSQRSAFSTYSSVSTIDLTSPTKTTINTASAPEGTEDVVLDIAAKSNPSLVRSKIPSSAEGNISYTKQFKDFTRKLGKGNPKAFYGKDYTNSVPNSIDVQENKLSVSLDEMWERDLEDYRYGTWNNTAMSVTEKTFYDLPCKDDENLYLMRRFCPDPRPWTHITIRLGVIKNPPNPNNPDLTVCRKCLEDQPALQTTLTQIRNTFNDPSLDIEDAFCVSYYGLPFIGWYGGMGLGASQNLTTYAVPFSSNGGYIGGVWYTNNASLKNLSGYKTGDRLVQDGCRSYEVHGRLQIYHDLTQETKIFAESVDKYGNPYDFVCGRQYGDLGEEDLYITEDAQNNDDSESPSQLSETVPEGY